MIRAQIATLPNRYNSLMQTVKSLINQVDSIFIAFNGPVDLSEYLFDEKIECGFFDNSKGDAMKFYEVEKFTGYFFPCDDDLIYPPDYVQRMINKINIHRCLVTHHGKIFANRPIRSYHHGATIRLRCLGEVSEGCYVDVCGSGVSAFHTDDLKLKLSDFKKPNMADIWLSKICHEQNVKMLCLPHPAGYFGYNHFTDNIYDNSHRNETFQTQLVNTFLKP